MAWLHRARRLRPWAVFSARTWVRIALISPGAVLSLLLFLVEQPPAGSEVALGVISVSWLLGTVVFLAHLQPPLPPPRRSFGVGDYPAPELSERNPTQELVS